MRLSGLIMCKNEAHRIRAALESIAFCDELIVVDSGSTDGTQAIAESFGARVVHRDFTGYGEQKEYGRQLATGEWLINIDADEVVTPELRAEITALVDRGGEPGVDGYLIPFRNHFRRVWVRRSGYYPDPHLRFVRRDRARWDPAKTVHEGLSVDGRVGRLFGHIDHYSFDSVDHFLEKSCRYAAAFAKNAHRAGRRATVFSIALHTAGRFFKAYVLKAGFLEGSLGLTISGLQAYEVFQKYVRLWELSRFSDHGR